MIANPIEGVSCQLVAQNYTSMVLIQQFGFALFQYSFQYAQEPA
jgi:hypothetical protein